MPPAIYTYNYIVEFDPEATNKRLAIRLIIFLIVIIYSLLTTYPKK